MHRKNEKIGALRPERDGYLVKRDLAFIEKMERIMDSVHINGFHFHDVVEGKEYEWKPQCGPQPLDKVEEVVAYRGQDIMTYYFVKEDHVRTSELVNPHVDWDALNENCRRDLLRIYTPQELDRSLKRAKFAHSYRKNNQYFVTLLNLVLSIYHHLMDAYSAVLQDDSAPGSYFLQTCHKEKGELVPHPSAVLRLPFDEWLNVHGMDAYLEMQCLKKSTKVMVLAYKDLREETYDMTIPYASDWRELMR